MAWRTVVLVAVMFLTQAHKRNQQGCQHKSPHRRPLVAWMLWVRCHDCYHRHHHRHRCGKLQRWLETRRLQLLSLGKAWVQAKCQSQIVVVDCWLGLNAMLFELALVVQPAMLQWTTGLQQWLLVSWQWAQLVARLVVHNGCLCLCLSQLRLVAMGNHGCCDSVNHTYHNRMQIHLYCHDACPCLCLFLCRSTQLWQLPTPAILKLANHRHHSRRLANRHSHNLHTEFAMACPCLCPFA